MLNSITTLAVWELINTILCALVAGMFFGPYLALSRSIDVFEPKTFLAIVHQLNKNISQVMKILMPLALLSFLPILFSSYNYEPMAFWLTAIAFGLFIVALIVTVLVEVPIVKEIDSWTVSKLPKDWQKKRDRWKKFHLIRVVAAIVGLTLLVASALL